MGGIETDAGVDLTVRAVPEPSESALLCAGAMGLLAMGGHNLRKRQQLRRCQNR